MDRCRVIDGRLFFENAGVPLPAYTCMVDVVDHAIAVDLCQQIESLERENKALRESIAAVKLGEHPRFTLDEDALDSLWDTAEQNTIDEIVCRVHPKGADAIFEFWEWFKPQEDKWLGPHRAAGAWLYSELKRIHGDARAQG